MFVPAIQRRIDPKPKLLCRLFGHRDKFLRGERFEGMFSDYALAMTYVCRWCKREDTTVTEFAFRLSTEIK